METNVSLTPELERFAKGCVEAGRFDSFSEVVCSALRLLQAVETRRAAFVASLEAATAEGDRDGFVNSDEVEAQVMAAVEAARARGG